MSQFLHCKVNGEEIAREVEDDRMLLAFLREDLKLTGTKEGCGEGDCGACTVLLDGISVNSCLVPALLAEGKEITTIEGIEKNGELSEIQKSFIRHGAIQCGFCSPGMIMSAEALLRKNPHPDREQIRRGISGNLCRCTGYQQIVDAIMEIAETRNDCQKSTNLRT